MLITLITMIGEIFFGYKTHSMSLLADGFHMGTHEVAFIITAIVCYLSIKYQNNEKNRYCTRVRICAWVDKLPKKCDGCRH